MPPENNLAAQANKWMEKISDLMGSPDKQLDQTEESIKSSLEKLRLKVEIEKTAAGAFHETLAKFKKDLDEIGIRGAKQTPYLKLFQETWNKHEMSQKMQNEEILTSKELTFVNDFISDLSNLPKLKEIIDSAEPEAKWQIWLKSIVGGIPGLEGLVDDYFGPVMKKLGVGWLIKPKKEKAQKEEENNGKKTPAKNPEKAEEKESKESEEDVNKKETREVVRRNPGATLFAGDSITVNMVNKCNKSKEKPLRINGPAKTVAKGGQTAAWGLIEIKKLAAQKPSPLEKMENAIVLFGTNDIGSNRSAESIFKYLTNIYRILKENGVRNVYAVTVPPFGGYKEYDRRPHVNKKREKLNEMIRKTSDADYVIDLCKKISEGGLADDNDPQRLDKHVTGDHLHIVKTELGAIYQEALETKGTSATEKRDQNIPNA